MISVTTANPAVGLRGLRLRGLLVLGLLILGLLITGVLATGTPARAATITASETSSIVSSATAAAQSATRVRKEANGALQGYLDDYGDRLSAAERGRVTYWQRTGDRSLRQVQIQARRTAALAHSGASPTRVNAARERAIAAHAQARRDVDAALTELVPVLSTRLHFLELLQARNDLESSLAGLDRLGQQLQAIPVAAR
jgi:hypothetical protein